MKGKIVQNPNKVSSYFKMEVVPLLIVTVSGILYNIGMTAGPYFEGQLAGRLFDVLAGKKTYMDMLVLAGTYVGVIVFVQFMRYIKRFYVRRFANDTNRNMRHMLYNSLVHKGKVELEKQSVGTIMTKAVSDVDACVEGMRKFTTEVFDTGIVLIAYMVMLLSYDWRLALLSSICIPIAYLIAEKLKHFVCRFTAQYKESAGRLNDATLDRVEHALTYRVFGREEERDRNYEVRLTDYEKKAVKANIWENTMQPIYNIISMTGVILIIYFGAKNMNGTGWKSWDIAAFTTFLSCFTKMAFKSSKAAKLFNAVQKAQVSWKRIKPLLEPYQEEEELSGEYKVTDLTVKNLSFAYPDGKKMIHNLSFDAKPGEVIGVTGPVATGKSTLGKVFLCEYSYDGTISINGEELSSMKKEKRSRLISYMGHQPELMSDTLRENITLGLNKEIDSVLDTVCLQDEVREMDKGADTYLGNGGIRLSGGQQARGALARTLYQDGSLLILDDPFSAVDRKTELQIMENIKSEYKDRIILIISHRLTLFPTFEQIIWMDEEQEIVGTHKQLMEDNPLYRRLYTEQEKGGDRNESSDK